MGINLLRSDADSALFLAAFLLLFALDVIVALGLDFLNRRELLRHAGPPPVLRGHLDPETFAKSRAYALDRLRFDSASLLWGALITLAVLLSGFLPWLERALAGPLGRGPAQGAAFLSAITVLTGILKLPFSAWQTFRLEGRHGFNTMTWGLWCKDLVKGALLSAVLGLPLLYALLAVMGRAGELWWLWAFLLVLGFQLLMMILYPTFIAPLFNRFKPMEEGPLKASLLDLADSLRFPSRGIFVMDGSRRSTHSNAYFTGFGRFRRIVLFDTLLSQMEPRELKSVLAHEIGHYRLGHIHKHLAIQAVMLLALFWTASTAFAWPPLYEAFGFPPPGSGPPGAAGPGPAVGLFLFLTVISSLSLLFAPLQNLLSRRHEYQADAYAVRAVGDAEGMARALLKLSRKNLSNPTPHPWYSAFHYSHPALAERLAALRGTG